MHVEVFDDAASFLARTDAFLLKNEAGNNLILSVASALVQNPHHGAPFFAAVSDAGGALEAASIWISGRKLVLTDGPADAGHAIARRLLERKDTQPLPGVLAPPTTGDAFCEAWQKGGGPPARLGLRQLILRLDFNAAAAKPLPPGRLRRAWLEDLPRLRSWAAAMVEETGLEESTRETAEITRRAIENRQLFVWDDRRPVAMVGHSGHTLHGARINSVYVPPDQRRKGYARAAVWTLGDRLRQAGKHFVCLFADSRSAASVNLYRSMGYVDAGTCNEYRFDFPIDRV